MLSDGRESRYHADHVRALEQDGRGGKEDEGEDNSSPTQSIQDQEEETLLATYQFQQNQAPPTNTHREDIPPAPTPPEEVHVYPQPASVEMTSNMSLIPSLSSSRSVVNMKGEVW